MSEKDKKRLELLATLNDDDDDDALRPYDIIDDEVIFCEDVAIKFLIQKDELVVTCQMEVMLMANDIFVWGAADLEPVKYTEIQSIYDTYMAHGTWGVVRWICFHRGRRPQLAIENELKEKGLWNDDLEALPSGAV